VDLFLNLHIFQTKNQQKLPLLFAEDQVIISNSEDSLQKTAYKFNQIIIEHCLTISVQKTKLTVFTGRDPVRSKIVIKQSHYRPGVAHRVSGS